MSSVYVSFTDFFIDVNYYFSTECTLYCITKIFYTYSMLHLSIYLFLKCNSLTVMVIILFLRNLSTPKYLNKYNFVLFSVAMLQLLYTCNTLCCSYSCGYHLNFLICVFIQAHVPLGVAWLSPSPSIVGRCVHNVQPHAGIEETKCSFSLRMDMQSVQKQP